MPKQVLSRGVAISLAEKGRTFRLQKPFRTKAIQMGTDFDIIADDGSVMMSGNALDYILTDESQFGVKSKEDFEKTFTPVVRKRGDATEK